jgi:hypothetical protein
MAVRPATLSTSSGAALVSERTGAARRRMRVLNKPRAAGRSAGPGCAMGISKGQSPSDRVGAGVLARSACGSRTLVLSPCARQGLRRWHSERQSGLSNRRYRGDHRSVAKNSSKSVSCNDLHRSWWCAAECRRQRTMLDTSPTAGAATDIAPGQLTKLFGPREFGYGARSRHRRR